MLKVPHRWVVVAVLLGLLATLKSAVAGQDRDGPKIQRDIPSLYQSLAVYFPMGAAIWQDDISGAHSELLTRHFNSITAENAMKWAVIEPSEGHFNFAPADALVEFAKANHMRVRGHTLCWHKQLPAWVFEDSSGKQMTPSPENKALLLRRLENHIRAVVAHYKNDVYAWDVVNEVIDPAQRDGFRRSPWFLIAGRDYIDAAFRVAHEVSPEAKLYINDYDTTDLPKRTFLYKLVNDLRGRGVPVDGVGHQMHSTIQAPSAAAVVKTIDLFSSLGVDNQITELDVSVYTDETSRYATIPDELLLRQGNQYRAYFDAFRKLKGKISSVTLWGLADDHTWKKGFPIRRLDLPLLFDEQLQTKSAFWAIVDPAHLPLSRASADDEKVPPYKSPQLPIEQRVSDLVSRMTLEEKISQFGDAAAAVPRLGVPQYNWWNEGLHGVARAGVATVYPQAIGLAATFDVPMVHQVADTISTEFRAKYNATVHPDGSTDQYRGLTVWSPNINIFRDPRWGRGQETYGEDPFLTSRLGVAFVTGLQGNDPKYLKTVATPKHFAVHSGPETTRHGVDVQISRHDLEDTYLPAFRATILEGKANSIMCAYNSLDGQPACANSTLLEQHLRKDWGFQGYVVSDCGAVADIFNGHHYAQSMAAASAVALKSGTDLVCGAPQRPNQYEHEGLVQAVREGTLREADLDRALQRLFTARFRLGMFDPPDMVPYSRIPVSENDNEAHRRSALRAAQESLVLLKNKEHFLPLAGVYKTIAVIGPDADNLDGLVGNYNGTPSRPVTILAGLRRRFPESRVIYAEGTGLIGPVTKAVPAESCFTDPTRTHHGLKAEYFANTRLEGEPVLTRVDKTVDFHWGTSGVSPQLTQNYSVRWTGVLVPPATGDYVIGFSGQDGYRLWLDGNLIVEDWSTHRPATLQTRELHLEQGHPYEIRIDYFQTVRFAEARLVWSIPKVEKEAALTATRNADLVVVVLGLSPRIEGEEMKVHADGFAGGDRTSLDLPKQQEELLEDIAGMSKPIVLVMVNGSALAVNWADQHTDAILEAWYPGEEGGTAVAQALAGDFSPAGRLPVTFYKSVDQLPPFEDYSMAKRTYRYFEGEPLYSFGYGLSYTSFSYSWPEVDHSAIPADGVATVSATVTNRGKMASDEVVQLYLTHTGIAAAPLRSLEGFKRIHLNPGQSTIVSFKLTGRDLSIVDDAGRRQIPAGTVQVWIGGGQPVTRQGLARMPGVQIEFKITNEAALPD